MGGAREAVWKPSPPEMRRAALDKERRHEELLNSATGRHQRRGSP